MKIKVELSSRKFKKLEFVIKSLLDLQNKYPHIKTSDVEILIKR